MSISGIKDHVMYGKYPCRLPVWWGYFGDIGVKPDFLVTNFVGAAGNFIMLVFLLGILSFFNH